MTMGACSNPTTGIAAQEGDRRVPVEFVGGHYTEPIDRGRPVQLIGAALGVSAEVFREAFSGVTPARGRGPTGAEARANKQALMRVLGPYGITNNRLDEVSNYYRYRPQAGEMWPTRDAKAVALVVDGRIVGFEITDGGAGYNSRPQIRVEGFGEVPATVTVEYGTNLSTNGRVTAIELLGR